MNRFDSNLWKCGFWAIVCKTVRPMLSDRYPVGLSCRSVSLVYCGQTVGWIKVPLGMEVDLGPDDIVLDGELGTQLSPWKGYSSPHFLAHVYCGGTAGFHLVRR